MLPEKNKSSLLPIEFQKYFWDVNYEDLNMRKYSRFIAERILNYGDLDGIKWLLTRIDRNFIKTLVGNSRNLNTKTKNYWQIMLP